MHWGDQKLSAEPIRAIAALSLQEYGGVGYNSLIKWYLHAIHSHLHCSMPSIQKDVMLVRPSERGTFSVRSVPTRVSIVYLVAGVVWIIASDQLLFSFFGSSVSSLGSTVKGLLFVVVTGSVFYVYLRWLASEVHKSHQRLHTTLTSIGDAVIATDSDGRVFLMNPVAERLTGISSAEASGKPLSDVLEILDADDNRLLPRVFDESKAGGAVRFEGRVVQVRPSGPGDDSGPGGRTERHISGLATPMLDPSGEIVGVVCVLRDITGRIRGQRALRQSQQELDTIFDSVPVFIFYKDKDSRILRVNRAFADAMGRPQEEWIGKTTHELFTEEADEMVKDDKEVLTTGQPKLNVIRRYHGPKGTRLVKVDTIPYRDVNGNIVGVLGVATDITDLEATRDALSRQEEEYRLLFSTMSDAFIVVECDPESEPDPHSCKLVQANSAFGSLVGKDPRELIGADLFELCPEHCEEWKQVIGQVLRTGEPGRFEGYLSRINKYVRAFVYRAPRNRVAIILIDDTERRQAEEHVEYLSYHDKLTGLYNRAYLEERLEEMNANATAPVSIIIGDVDGLKLVNDTFGHSEGDAYLRSVATALRNCCTADCIVARWGGDEFAILLPYTTEREADEIVRKIEAILSSQHYVRPGESSTIAKIPVGITLGHATRTDPDEDLAETMRRAESEMYKRKFLHRANIRNSMINALRETLSAKTHETEEHASRLTELALRVAKHVGLSERDQNELALLAMLHDIGKIGIPDRILEKPGPLTPEEWEIMKTHCVIGYRIASATPDLAPIATAILHHHEWWDGSGYPEGLSGEQIPIICRILSIVDALDAMTNDRPYRKAHSVEEALSELQACAGKQFDPRLVKLFVEMMTSGEKAAGSDAAAGEGR